MATKNNKNTRTKANDTVKTPKVSCKMELNEKLNGVELTFSAKPSNGIREALKSAGFKWHKQKAVWYAKQNDDTLTIAKALSEGSVDGAEVKPSTKSKKTATKSSTKSKKTAEKPSEKASAKSEPKAPKVEQKAIAFKGAAKPKVSAKLIKALNETEGLTAEMDRAWLWVSGDTKQYKESLKALGFRFSGKRQAWYLA